LYLIWIMDELTIRRLNTINRAFYALTATDFDESRGRPWPGWRRVLAHLTHMSAPLRVLDVGCGNGRFGRFLARNLPTPLHYHGIDSAPALLESARVAFARMGILQDAILEARDVVESPPDAGTYDLVAAFGVLHHVPGAASRLTLVRALAERVAPGGILTFTGWCFWEYPRFRERAVAWPADITREPGDHLLDWRRGHAAHTALRYCHYIDDDEHAALVAASGLTAVETFRADGHTGDINRYAVLRRPALGR
jgi:tRNA (uracil-5-)-methyltransferase TRM9